MDHFLAVVRGDEASVSDGAFGLEVVRIIDAAQRSLVNGGAPEAVVR